MALIILGASVGLRSSRADGPTGVVGERPKRDPGHFSIVEFDRLERTLQRELSTGDDRDEILALLSAGYWGSQGQIVVHVKGDQARLIFTSDDARFFDRPMSADELKDLRAFLTKAKAFDLGQLPTNIADGMQFELLRLTKAAGRRVFMSNPGPVDARPYLSICERFEALLGKPGLNLHYNAEKTNPDFQVIVSDPRWAVVGVHIDGSQLLLQVAKRRERGGPGVALPDSRRIHAAVPRVADGEAVWLDWPSMSPVPIGQLSALALDRIPVPNEIDAGEWLNRGGWASQRDRLRYVVGEFRDKEGLWRVSGESPPELVAAGKMSTPLLTADGQSIVVDRTDQSSWGHSGYFALVDIQARRIKRIAIESANDMVPLIPTSDGVLVVRSRADPRALPPDWKFQGPPIPEYFVIDGHSGAVTQVHGDFDPIPRTLANPLQAAGSGRVWAVKTDRRRHTSIIGRYELRKFTFMPVREVLDLAVWTNDIAVDEKAGHIYATYDGDLVRLSIAPDQKPTPVRGEDHP